MNRIQVRVRLNIARGTTDPGARVLTLYLQESFNNFIIEVENAEEGLSLDIILKAPEGNVVFQTDHWNINTFLSMTLNSTQLLR